VKKEGESTFFDDYAREFQSFLLLLKTLLFREEALALVFLQYEAVVQEGEREKGLSISFADVIVPAEDSAPCFHVGCRG
jgi:hypothetical protein